MERYRTELRTVNIRILTVFLTMGLYKTQQCNFDDKKTDIELGYVRSMRALAFLLKSLNLNILFSIYLFIYLSIYVLSISIHQSIYIFMDCKELSISLSIYLNLHLPVYLYTYPVWGV